MWGFSGVESGESHFILIDQIVNNVKKVRFSHLMEHSTLNKSCICCIF